MACQDERATVQQPTRLQRQRPCNSDRTRSKPTDFKPRWLEARMISQRLNPFFCTHDFIYFLASQIKAEPTMPQEVSRKWTTSQPAHTQQSFCVHQMVQVILLQLLLSPRLPVVSFATKHENCKTNHWLNSDAIFRMCRTYIHILAKSTKINQRAWI